MIKTLELKDQRAQQHLLMQLVALGNATTGGPEDPMWLDQGELEGHQKITYFLFDKFGKPQDKLSSNVAYVLSTSPFAVDKYIAYRVTDFDHHDQMIALTYAVPVSSATDLLKVTVSNLRTIIANGLLYQHDENVDGIYKPKSSIHYQFDYAS